MRSKSASPSAARDARGDRLVRTDAATGTSAALFDQVALAASLSKVLGGKPLDPMKLALRDLAAAGNGRYLLSVRGARFSCDSAGACAAVAKPKSGDEPGVLSPDRRTEVFIRNWNLWSRDVASGQEAQLTTDGVENYGYATDNAGWKHTDRAIALRTSGRPARCTW